MVMLRNPLTCPRCGLIGTVFYTRDAEGHRWRRRQCGTCKDRKGKPYRWNTYETIEDPTLKRADAANKSIS